MTVRALRYALLATFATALLAGCSAGRFIAGASSTKPAATNDSLLGRRCSGCHEQPSPSAMTADEWQESLERMKRRMHLPEAEWAALAAMRTKQPVR